MQKNMAYANFKDKLATKGYTDAVVTQSTLQLEAVVSATETILRFKLTDDAGGNRKTERRLLRDDVFMVTDLGLFVKAAANTNDVTAVMATYPNPAIFSTAGAASALETLYAGVLKLTVENRIYLPGWELMQHKFVPQIQNAALPSPVIDSTHFGRDSFVPVYPTMTLSGNKNIDLQIVLPSAIPTLQAGKETVVVLKLKGFLAQNAATYA